MVVLDGLKTVPAFVVQLVVLAVLLGIKFARVAEERRRGIDLHPRRPTVAAAFFLFLGLILGLAGQFPGIYGFNVDNHPIQYVQNVAVAGGYFSLLFLYLPPRSVRVGPRRREIAIFASYAAVLAVLSALMAYLDLPNGDSARQLHNSAIVATFYLVATAYLVYIAGAVALRSAAYVRQTSGWTRSGLTLIAVAAVMQSLGSISRIFTISSAVLTAGYPQLVYKLASPLFNLSKPMLVLGLILPLFAGRAAAIRRRLDRQRRYRQMQTLATVAVLVFPEIGRGDVPGSSRSSQSAEEDKPGRGRFKFRYIRRVTECRDALNRAANYGDVNELSVLGPQDDSAPQRFHAELQECGFDHESRSYRDLDIEADCYATVSTRMRRRGITWVSSGPEVPREPEVPMADQV